MAYLVTRRGVHFVMELPPYHLPTINGVFCSDTWHRLKSFLIKAGKLILLLVTILGFLNTMGTDGSFGHADSSRSVLSSIKGLPQLFIQWELRMRIG